MRKYYRSPAGSSSFETQQIRPTIKQWITGCSAGTDIARGSVRLSGWRLWMGVWRIWSQSYA
jgi:hypothetical protein